MALDERSRHDLHVKLAQLLGPEPAATLMALLPPVGWADVATKRDLDELAYRFRVELRGEINALRADLRAEMNAQLRSIYTAMIATMLGTATLSGTLAFAAARLV